MLGHALPPLDWVIHLLPTKLITSMTQQYIEGRRQSKERKREKRLGSSRRQESTIERHREREREREREDIR